MKTDFKLSSKMHLFIIISCVIIALGVAVGTICQFVANGYFNYGSDWSDYKCVTVSYACVDFSNEKEVRKICDDAFASDGLKYYNCAYGDVTGDIVGGEFTFKFGKSVNDEKLASAVEKINAKIQSGASVHTVEGFKGNTKALWRGAVAIASVMAAHFIYFAIRYKLTMALGALLADVHNLAVFVSLLSLARIPVGSAIITFAVLTVLVTAVGTCFLFDRVRKNCKDENASKLSAFDLTDKSASESFKVNLFVPVVLCAVAVLLFVLMSISAMSVFTVLSPVLCALACFVSCAYGTLFFTPAVYSRFKLIGDDYKLKHARAKKEKLSK